MNDVTIRAGLDEQLKTHVVYFDPEGDRWCSIYIISPRCDTTLRLESHASSLHLLDELRGRLEEASRYLRGGTM